MKAYMKNMIDMHVHVLALLSLSWNNNLDICVCRK